MKVRTRIAPSPTGDPHVGTAYIALFNLCFARQHGGQFVLRIEDTDQVRSTRESEEMIIKSLRWLGLDWDEGPDVGGPHGPYRQSERYDLYKEHAQILLDAGHAFRCFCTPERLAEMRQKQDADKTAKGYDGLCAGIDPAESAKRAADGESHVVRMKVPREGVCVVQDLLRDPIEIAWTQVDMQILIKSDGMPTYHLANVVDDHFMDITHVLRGEEWISSAPKHLLLYQYFGWEAPVLCHLPLLRNTDRSKLSKRKNPTSILFYQRLGLLPEGLINYLGRMAWSMPDGQEMFTFDEMVKNFDLERISLGGPIFDVDKLKWLNSRWIRESLTEAQFAKAVTDWALNSGYLTPLVPLVQQRIKVLSDLGPLAAHFLSGQLDTAPLLLTKESFQTKDVSKIPEDDLLQILQFGLWRLEGLRSWTADDISEALRSLAETRDLKLRVVLKPFFIALSGQEVTTPLFQSMEALGADITRARIRHALTVLTDGKGISGKRQKKWRKVYDAL